QHAVHGGEPDVLTRIEQMPVHILGTQVMALAFSLLQQLQDFHPWQCDLETRLAQFLVFSAHDASPLILNALRFVEWLAILSQAAEGVTLGLPICRDYTVAF